MSKNISAEFPFKSNCIEVNGSKMHYVDEGSGDPILFLHGNPSDMHSLISDYCQKLQNSTLPKLLFYATPGGIVTSEVVEWSKEKLKNLKTIDIGSGIHYIQEDNPHKIAMNCQNGI